jgi:hypothetical protein
MRDEFLGLFRRTDRSHATEAEEETLETQPAGAETATEEKTVPGRVSVFLQRFLAQVARSPELAPSGMDTLDARLAGGFGPGLNLICGRPGTGKTALLESVAWDALLSGRPVIYYALKEGGLGVWEHFVRTLSHINESPGIRLSALRARELDSDELRALVLLDQTLQESILPRLSLIETIPAHLDMLSGFIEDVRTRVAEAEDVHGRIPVLLVDDLDRLLLFMEAHPVVRILLRLDEALASDSIPALLSNTLPDPYTHALERLPAHTVLALSVSGYLDDLSQLDLEIRANGRTGWTGAIPLILDRESGLVAPA